MKKALLLIILGFQFMLGYGQTSADWGSWITADCYSGIKYKTANWGKVSGDYSDYYWGLMFQNTYSQPVSFSYLLNVGDEKQPTKYNYTVTYKIEPGGVYSNDGTKATAILFKSSSSNYKIYIKDVCLGNCENNNYINCQGISQTPITTSTTSSTSNSANQTNNTITTTPQNDLKGYSIGSKGDLKNSNNQSASFNGDWIAFSQQNLKYPILAAENDIQGKVVVSFVVDELGNVVNIKAISGPKELYEAAENLIRKSNGMWIPAKQNNKFVSQPTTVPINFQLN